MSGGGLFEPRAQRPVSWLQQQPSVAMEEQKKKKKRLSANLCGLVEDRVVRKLISGGNPNAAAAFMKMPR